MQEGAPAPHEEEDEHEEEEEDQTPLTFRQVLLTARPGYCEKVVDPLTFFGGTGKHIVDDYRYPDAADPPPLSEYTAAERDSAVTDTMVEDVVMGDIRNCFDSKPDVLVGDVQGNRFELLTAAEGGLGDASMSEYGYSRGFDDLYVHLEVTLSSARFAKDPQRYMGSFGGNTRNIKFWLVDKQGEVVPKCSVLGKFSSSQYDSFNTCGRMPVAPCFFDVSDNLVLPVKAILSAAGLEGNSTLAELDDAEVHIDECTEKHLTKAGLSHKVYDRLLTYMFDENGNTDDTHQGFNSEIAQSLLRRHQRYMATFYDSAGRNPTYEELRSFRRSSCEKMPWRATGVLLKMFLDCNNIPAEGKNGVESIGSFAGPYNSAQLGCRIQVIAQPSAAPQPGKVTVEMTHTGTVYWATFSDLLLALASSFALIAVAGTLTEFFMLKISLDRDVYHKAKFVKTVDFSDMRQSGINKLDIRSRDVLAQSKSTRLPKPAFNAVNSFKEDNAVDVDTVNKGGEAKVYPEDQGLP